jgi:cytochrome P450
MRLSTPPFAAVDLSAIDFLDSAFYATGDPHAVWAHLREHDPVHYFDPGDGREPFWIVSRYADVARVLRDYEYFSSRHGTMLSIIDLAIPDISTDQMIPDSDPPRHEQLRDPLNHLLSRQAVESRAGELRQTARSVLAPGLAGEPIDIAASAAMLPMSFAGRLIGIPERAWPAVARLTGMTTAYADPEYLVGAPKSTLQIAHHEIFAVFNEEVASRDRDDAGQDLIGALMRMRLDGDPLSVEQIVVNAFSILLGANATTPHVAATAVAMFAQHPDQFRMLREDPGLIPSAVEETLRWASPTSHFLRYATKDVELQGQLIHAGQPVTAWLGSANRDNRMFPDPYRFDITRTPNRHLTFGRGVHFCIGAALARFALQLFVTELADACAGIELLEVDHLHSNFTAGYRRMLVRFEPCQLGAAS